MSVYVIKRKNQKQNEFICSAPTFQLAVRILKDMEVTDKEMKDYIPERYGIIKREYCPAHEYHCECYMMGICSRREPKSCNEYKEHE